MATVATRLSWDGGLNFATDGSAEFEPAVVAPPGAVSAGERVSAAFAIDSATMSGTEVAVVQRVVSKPYQRHRIIVGGKDVTYFRGVQTPMPTYSLVSPLLFGPGQISFPQIHAVYERPGHGDLTWLRKFAPVVVQRVDAAGNVVATDHRGRLSDRDHSGRVLSFSIEGQAEGRAARVSRPIPIFPRPIDIGAQALRTVRQRLRLPVGSEPDTGIILNESGGGSQLDFLLEILAKSGARDGKQWTVMPNSSGVYRMFQKDTETIGLTLYPDDKRVVANLRRDYTEEPNRIWAHAVDTDGMRLRPAIFPGLTSENRPSFPGTMSPGDDGTAAFEKLRWRLWTVGYLDGIPPPDVWTTDDDDPVTQAIIDLQDDAGLSETGVVNSATWDAAFDPAVTEFSLRGSAEKPAAQRSYTKAYLRSASGRVLKPNPAFDRSRELVDVTIDDMGVLNGPRQLRRFAQREMADDNTANWVGTIVITTGAVIDGEHNPGDALDASMIREARSVKPGQNAWLPTWDGGTLVHVSGVNVSPGSVELVVDTRARDTMKVWEVRRRNRESRTTLERQWLAQNRRSGQRDNTGAWYDGSVFGKTTPVDCPADQWTVFPVVAGRSGTLHKVDISTDNSPALYGMAIFGKHIEGSRLDSIIGDPLTKAGTVAWRHNLRSLTDDHWLVFSAGGVDSSSGIVQPCGYWPEVVDPNDTTTATRTGSANASSDRLTIHNHGYANGRQVYFSSGSVPSGLTADNNYYVINRTTDTFQVSASLGGSAMNITADATGVAVAVHYVDLPPVTGDFRDEAGVPYFCKGQPVLWVAIHPDRDTTVQGGRILTLLLDDAAG